MVTYEFEIQHRAGKLHPNVDALLRKPGKQLESVRIADVQVECTLERG